MVARLLRIATLGLLAAALLWLLLWLQQGRPAVAMVGAFLIAGTHAVVLAIEFILLAFVNRGDPAPAAGPQQLLRAWWAEVWVAARVFGWTQPYRSNLYPDRVAPAGRRGVVLVHGFFCNRGVWNPWLLQLHADQVPVIAVNLEAVFGSIDDGAPIVEQAVARMHDATGLAPVIVAHSMGGLVARAWLDRFGGDSRVHRVITVGTPHQGTWLARFSLSANTRQMRRAGEWLGAIGRREPATRAARFTCFYSHCDNIVFPASTATLRGADNQHLPGVAHVEMVYQPEVRVELTRWLGSAAGDSSAAASGAAAASAR